MGTGGADSPPLFSPLCFQLRVLPFSASTGAASIQDAQLHLNFRYIIFSRNMFHAVLGTYFKWRDFLNSDNGGIPRGSDFIGVDVT